MALQLNWPQKTQHRFFCNCVKNHASMLSGRISYLSEAKPNHILIAKMMKLVIMLFVAINLGTCKTMWETWNSPDFSPTWEVQQWKQPNPIGWKRNTIHAQDPIDRLMTIRDNQYMWIHEKYGYKIFCAPESYPNEHQIPQLNGFYCVRNPNYWPPSAPKICKPNMLNPLVSCNKQSNWSPFPCCYDKSGSDISEQYAITPLVLNPKALGF